MDTKTIDTIKSPETAQWIAFDGVDRIASGSRFGVAARVKERLDRDPYAALLVFDNVTSERVELDLRGTIDDVVGRLEASAAAPASAPEAAAALPDTAPGPGRPKLGVIPREVTLLPRHWEWLNGQPGGASVALRKLVEEARRTHREQDRIRIARESAYRFLSAIAGDLPGFKHATRALFAGDRPGFVDAVRDWPTDIRDHAVTLAAAEFDEAPDTAMI